MMRAKSTFLGAVQNWDLNLVVSNYFCIFAPKIKYLWKQKLFLKERYTKSPHRDGSLKMIPFYLFPIVMSKLK